MQASSGPVYLIYKRFSTETAFALHCKATSDKAETLPAAWPIDNVAEPPPLSLHNGPFPHLGWRCVVKASQNFFRQKSFTPSYL